MIGEILQQVLEMATVRRIRLDFKDPFFFSLFWWWRMQHRAIAVPGNPAMGALIMGL